MGKERGELVREAKTFLDTDSDELAVLHTPASGGAAARPRRRRLWSPSLPASGDEAGCR
jgi:hypothetical protein